jgi:transcriptional regulator with XRE-family HTH domain
VGLGTGWVESLASYLGRTAEAHAVRVSDLMAYLVAKPTTDRLRWDHQVLNLLGRRSHELNGAEQVAQRWSTLLAEQTLRRRLEQLTLLPWRQVLTSRGLAHESQWWCPQCLDDWFAADRPIYWPLLWSLHVVTLCPVHRFPLAHRCPHCQAPVLVLMARGRLGFCPKCHGWLGWGDQREGTRAPVPNSIPVTDIAVQIAQGVLELLAASARIPDELPGDKLGTLLGYCLRTAQCPQEHLAKRLSLPRDALHKIIAGRRRVSVLTLLRVLGSLDLAITDFVQQPVTTLVATRDLEHWISQLRRPTLQLPPPKLRQGQHPTAALLADAQALLETALTQADPPALPILARRLGLTTIKVLTAHFPQLCQAIMAKRKGRLNRAAMQQALNKGLNSERPRPSLETIAARLKVSPITLRKYCPDEVAAFSARRRIIRDPAALRRRVEAFLTADPPLSLSEISRRLDVKVHHIAQHCPELRRALVARFKVYQHGRAVEHERQAIAAVRAAVNQVHARGELPTKSKVAAIVCQNRRAILTKSESEAFHARMSELGLWQL